MAQRNVHMYVLRAISNIMENLPKPSELSDDGFFVLEIPLTYDEESVGKFVRGNGSTWDLVIEENWLLEEDLEPQDAEGTLDDTDPPVLD